MYVSLCSFWWGVILMPYGHSSYATRPLYSIVSNRTYPSVYHRWPDFEKNLHDVPLPHAHCLTIWLAFCSPPSALPPPVWVEFWGGGMPFLFRHIRQAENRVGSGGHQRQRRPQMQQRDQWLKMLCVSVTENPLIVQHDKLYSSGIDTIFHLLCY